MNKTFKKENIDYYYFVNDEEVNKEVFNRTYKRLQRTQLSQNYVLKRETYVCEDHIDITLFLSF